MIRFLILLFVMPSSWAQADSDACVKILMSETRVENLINSSNELRRQLRYMEREDPIRRRLLDSRQRKAVDQFRADPTYLIADKFIVRHLRDLDEAAYEVANRSRPLASVSTEFVVVNQLTTLLHQKLTPLLQWEDVLHFFYTHQDELKEHFQDIDALRTKLKLGRLKPLQTLKRWLFRSDWITLDRRETMMEYVKSRIDSGLEQLRNQSHILETGEALADIEVPPLHDSELLVAPRLTDNQVRHWLQNKYSRLITKPFVAP